MKFTALTATQKKDLERLHRYERDSRVCDRIKAVLLKNEGWANKQIAQALRIHEETVREHLTQWLSDEKLKPENGGSYSKLSERQSSFLEKHIESSTYTRVRDICASVATQWHIYYTVSGMTKWLKAHGFSYKTPKATPAKVDVEQQEAFIGAYLQLQETASKDEPILFMDSVHPTMATQVARAWIKKGPDKLIAKTGSKTRVNVTGAIELNTMKVVSFRPEKVNAETPIIFFKKLKAAYPEAKKLPLFLDNAGYCISHEVKKAALDMQIELHYLPPYSPNLNPIERLWKVMNEIVRNNRFFPSPQSFRGAIGEFFDATWKKIAPFLRGRINDNFQIIKPVPSG